MTAFEKAVAEGEKTEDAYTAALEACSNEQERQELITKTLTKLYGKAATQYKKTNKQVIESNKANEEWNETLADLGDDMAPVVTEVKRFGSEVLKNAKEPLKDVAGFLGDDVLPALSRLGKWVSENTPIIKASLAAVAAGLVTYKVAVIGAEVAQNGLKKTILATEVAQKALNLAQAATPWGLAAVAIGGVVAALGVYLEATNNATGAVDVLTEEERELMAAAAETAQAFRDQKAATDEAVGDVSTQMGHVQSLANELLALADASGKVKETDEARAQFILNELNEALGTEYTMTDGVIQQYEELKNSIDQVIQSKTVNSLLEARNADYIAAIDAEAEALANVGLRQKELEAAEAQYAENKAKIEEQIRKLRKQLNDDDEYISAQQRERLEARLKILEGNLVGEQNVVKGKQKAWEEAMATYGMYHDTVMDYEEAQTASLEGNYERALELLKSKGAAYGEYSDDVSEATREAIDALYKEAIDAGIEAARTKENFENGVEGYTKEMVDEAEQGYEDALGEWAEAYDSAHEVGADLGGGLQAGMENTRPSLISKARSIVNGIISAMRKAADSHSPSRKLIDFGEDMGAGAEIGLENTTPDLLKTARKQVQQLITTYRTEGEDPGQKAVQGVAERSAARSAESVQSFLVGNNSKLDKILEAIKAGQVILLDGDTLVGATAGATDNALGQRRALVARGAI